MVPGALVPPYCLAYALDVADHVRFQQNCPGTNNAVSGLQALEYLDPVPGLLTGLHLGNLPQAFRAGLDHVIRLTDVQHAVGRNHEPLADVRAQADLGEHARLEPAFRIADLKEDPQRAAVLGERRRQAADSACKLDIGKGVEPGHTGLAGLRQTDAGLWDLRDDDGRALRRLGQQLRVDARLVKLPLQGGQGPLGVLDVRLGLVFVFLALDFRLQIVGLGGGQIFFRIGPRLHEFLQTVGHFLLRLQGRRHEISN